ncbi:ABC transporter ATP-binding protein [Streptomyces diacarni]|uniref:ABC transporter ATP-binding protein n=1 Tax=Streptomyces diacarni TaxID=2800381 RepID=A0A367F044_9ACTN|nr:ABC transporter ATP-binding protein [Streptomyces diacarni]RCG23703.1 ABC transporter ATP-binding protein [Streptomyces diacarni]
MTAATTVTAPATTALSVSGLVKTFGATRALDGLDLQVATGEVHGFLGPNGAGKSTTLRILLGLLRADTGTARLLGADPWDDAVALHRRLAYVPGDVELWPGLTGGEAIDLLARLRGGIDAARRAELVERFDLDPTKKGRTYSKGNRQKVALIAALASDAELLLLDEPTAGLDPLMEVVFQDLVLQARNEGRTVLLSSHILSQVEKVCDRVSIVRLGRVVQSGTLSEMRHLTRTTIEAEIDPTRHREGGAHPASGLARLPGVHDLRTEGARVRFSVDGAHLEAAVRHLGDLGVRSLNSHPPTLEELMLRHYGDELAATGHGTTTDGTTTPDVSRTDTARTDASADLGRTDAGTEGGSR